MSEILLISREKRLARLTLNRPEKRNALNLELCRLLVEAILAAEADRGVGAILLEGNGPVFCAGMDLDEATEVDPETAATLHVELFSLGAKLSKPLIAAVQGSALAGGLGLVANAHVALASDDAHFGLTETRIGLWPYTIFRAVAASTGQKRAVEMAITGRLLSAQEALAVGLVHHLAPTGQLSQKARLLAGHLADGSASAVAEGLAFVRETSHQDEQTAGRTALKYRCKAQNSADFLEGVRAWRQKRNPAWPSHGM